LEGGAHLDSVSLIKVQEGSQGFERMIKESEFSTSDMDSFGLHLESDVYYPVGEPFDTKVSKLITEGLISVGFIVVHRGFKENLPSYSIKGRKGLFIDFESMS